MDFRDRWRRFWKSCKCSFYLLDGDHLQVYTPDKTHQAIHFALWSWKSYSKLYQEYQVLHDPTICCLQVIYTAKKDIHKLRVKSWNSNYQMNRSSKRAGTAIFMFDKIDFRPKPLRRDTEGHYILTKGTLHQENVIAVIFMHRLLEPQLH